MENQQEVQSFEVAEIQRRIMPVRGVQVMLDRDLAELYGVELKALNQAVKRNAGRFPERFMQQIDQIWRQQILDQGRNEERFSTIFDALGRGRLLPSGIIPANTEFDSIRQVFRLVENAKSEIVVVDPYADAAILDVCVQYASVRRPECRFWRR